MAAETLFLNDYMHAASSESFIIPEEESTQVLYDTHEEELRSGHDS